MLRPDCRPYLSEAVARVCVAVGGDDGRTRTLPQALSESRLLRELAGCILGSRVRFEQAHCALEHLDRLGLLARPSTDQCIQETQQRMRDAMLDAMVRYPFAHQRAAQLAGAVFKVYEGGGSLRGLVRKGWEARKLRLYLVEGIPGIGMKQASLFLNRIGYSETLAVLDTHILSYMEWMGMASSPTRMPNTVGKYEHLEAKLQDHIKQLGVPLPACDLAIWITVRLVKKEFRRWVS